MVPTVPLPPSMLLAVQLTAVFVVPVTVAVNCTDPLGVTVAEIGETSNGMLDVEGGLLLELDPPPPQAAVKATRRSDSVLARDDLQKLQPGLRAALFKSLSDENFASRI